MTDLSVTGVSRGTIRMDSNFAREADVVATESNPNPDLELIEVPVYNLVIDHPDATILWDTGVHPEANDGYWPRGLRAAYPPTNPEEHRLEDDLDRVGYAIDDVDAVVQSHLHMDHAGGLQNFAGTDVPVYVHEDELSYAYLSAQTSAGSGGYLTDDFHHDFNWELVTLQRETHFPGVTFLTLPGHTPGNMGLELTVGDETLIFTSDLVEEHVNYAREQPPGPGLVWSRQHWEESLARVKERERQTDATVVYGHDPDQLDVVLEGWG